MTGWFERLTGTTLEEPAWLALLVLVAASLALALRSRRDPLALATAGFLGDAAPPPRAGLRARWTWLPAALQAAALALVTVALARPVERTRLPVETDGIDILLCLDVSSSMRQDDLAAGRSRLDVAKSAAAEFVAGRPRDRIGLVCFARFPEVRCPPTADHAALARFLEAVAPVASDGPEDATGIGAAVARAAQVLRTSEARSKVVILLTDGEENVATADRPDEISPVHAGQLCEHLGIRVYTIAAGVGDAGPGARRVDTRPAELLSERTGGRFFAARDAAAVAGVYAAIDLLERADLETPSFRVEERYAPFLASALVLLLLGLLLRTTVLDVLP